MESQELSEENIPLRDIPDNDKRTIYQFAKLPKDKSSVNMKVEIQKEWYSVAQCSENPNKLYIFGDNDMRVGKGGQAIIRDCPNSFGIPTKRKPSMEEDSFYSDEGVQSPALNLSLSILDRIITLGESPYQSIDTIVLPADGLGTGLAQMDSRAPKTWAWMNEQICRSLEICQYP